MKIKNYKCKCGFDEFFFASKGNQIGIYCIKCGKWLKWADKDEQNLTLKRIDNSVLDKIKAEITEEIMPITKDGVLVKSGCLRIIDKYKDKGVEE